MVIHSLTESSRLNLTEQAEKLIEDNTEYHLTAIEKNCNDLILGLHFFPLQTYLKIILFPTDSLYRT